MHIHYNNMYELFNNKLSEDELFEAESLSNDIKVMSTQDSANNINKFKTRPQGVIIQDSYNNFALPISNPQIDTSKFDLLEIYNQYNETYTDFKSLMLPWHYCVEMVRDRYFIMNTRPINLKYPIDSNTVLNFADQNTWDGDTQDFFSRNLFDISEAIHICLIGDSNLDIYPNKVYSLIGQVCLSPLFGYLKVIKGSTQNVFSLNIGDRFNMTILNKFIRR